MQYNSAESKDKTSFLHKSTLSDFLIIWYFAAYNERLTFCHCHYFYQTSLPPSATMILHIVLSLLATWAHIVCSVPITHYAPHLGPWQAFRLGAQGAGGGGYAESPRDALTVSRHLLPAQGMFRMHPAFPASGSHSYAARLYAAPNVRDRIPVRREDAYALCLYYAIECENSKEEHACDHCSDYCEQLEVQIDCTKPVS